jgi:hypothetical protein
MKSSRGNIYVWRCHSPTPLSQKSLCKFTAGGGDDDDDDDGGREGKRETTQKRSTYRLTPYFEPRESYLGPMGPHRFQSYGAGNS